MRGFKFSGARPALRPVVAAGVIAAAVFVTGCAEVTSSAERVKVRPGKTKAVKVTVTSVDSDREFINGSLCATSSYSKLKVKPRCHTSESLPIDASQSGKFIIRPGKRAKKGVYTVTFKATAENTPSVGESREKTIKVKVLKKK